MQLDEFEQHLFETAMSIAVDVELPVFSDALPDTIRKVLWDAHWEDQLVLDHLPTAHSLTVKLRAMTERERQSLIAR
jgi:hypothetical protein